MTAPEFLLTICEELGIGVPDSALGSLKDLVDILSQYLLRAHADGQRVVLVVDEAQNLAPEVLEQVRLLTNLETNTQKLLQIILIGQPELRELLARNELRQLAQRITGRYHLNPLSREETAAYVRHRLRVAGATTDIFAPGALNEVFRLSQGVPRVINVICDRALLGAYSLDRHRVTAKLVRSAAGEVFGRRFAPNWLPWALTAASAVALAAAMTGRVELLEPGARVRAARPHARPRPRLPRRAGGGGRGHGGRRGRARRNPPRRPRRAWRSCSRSTTPRPIPTAPSASCSGCGVPSTSPAAPIPCTQAGQQGLECVTERGSFGQLRLYNRPAILLLNDAGGASHQVVLTALDDEQAQARSRRHRTSVSIGELSRYWLGDFVMLWRPGSSPVKALSAGMRGAQVRWLRQSLQRLHGAAQRRAGERRVRRRSHRAGARLPAPAPAHGRRHRRRADPDRARRRAGRSRGAAPVRCRYPSWRVTDVVHPRRTEEIRERPPAPERAGAVRSQGRAAARAACRRGRSRSRRCCW